MTRVYIETDGKRHILSARGHATGSAEVCAAVSGILYALAGYLTLEESAQAHKHRMESADVLLDYSGGVRVESAYAMATVGLLQLRDAYPKLVEVEIFEN